MFEVDVNGILKVTATEKSSGRSANITISNSVGKLNSAEIEKMVEDAAKFKSSDDAFSKKFEARQQLESYISRVEEIVSDPGMSMKLKRGQKEKIESALSDAMAQLEIEDAGSDDLRKKELALKRVVTKVSRFLQSPIQLLANNTAGYVYPLSAVLQRRICLLQWYSKRACLSELFEFLLYHAFDRLLACNDGTAQK